ncbi:MAG: 5'-nucleotidase [Candidatus Dormiibacterota bacterium]
MAELPRQFVLGVDLDGVCADYYPFMRTVVAEWLGRDPESLPPDVGWEMAEWGVEPGEFHKMHRFAVVQRNLFQEMGMIPGAGPALRRLSNLGVRIRIITHRLIIEHFHQIAVSQTVEWLDRHAIPYWDLCFMGEKGAVNADLYIEDSPHNVEALLRDSRDVIVFTHFANQHLDVPPDRRAHNWVEAERLIGERFLAWQMRTDGAELIPRNASGP